MLELLRRDVRDGFRSLRSAPAISATIVCLVAVVVGGNTTIYGLVHALLTKPARGAIARGLVTIQRVEPGESPGPLHQYPDFEVFRDSARTLERIVAVRLEPLTLRIGSTTDALRGASVTAGYFELFGISLLRGRTFSDAEGRRDTGALTVIISEQLWHTRFESRPDILGQPVYVNGQAATVAGIVPAAFRGATLGELTDVWVPLQTFTRLTGGEASLFGTRPSVQVFARVTDGRSRNDAQAELSSLMEASHPDAPRESRPGAVVVPYSMTTAGDSLIARVAPRFLILFSVVTALTLLIVCANIANLVWVRGLARQHEMALRAAVGATRWHLIRPVAVEALMLGALAWIAASVCAAIATRLVVHFMDGQAGGALSIVDVSPDASVLVYAGLLTFCSVAVCSIVPALRPVHADLNAIVGKTGETPRRSLVARFLIVTQLSLSVVLLVLAGLAYRSVSATLSTDLGFDLDRLLLIRVDTAGINTGGEGSVILLERIRQAMQRLGEVEAASHANTTPAVRGRRMAISASSGSSPVTAEQIAIGPEFFRTLGVVPWRGREFSSDDVARGLPVAIVNRSVADRLWPGRPNVVGQTLVLDDDGEREVQLIGVVPDALFTGPRGQAVSAFVFVPSTHSERGRSATLYVRLRGRAGRAAATLRRSIGDIDTRVPIVSISTMVDAIDTLTAPQRIVVGMAISFAVACLLISAIGLNGLISFSVRRQRREFGVRQAVGASRTELLRLVLGEALMLTLVGVGSGFIVGGGVALAARAYLFGVSPLDITTYAAIASIVSLVAVIAVCGPALRASQVNPLVALRTD